MGFTYGVFATSSLLFYFTQLCLFVVSYLFCFHAASSSLQQHYLLLLRIIFLSCCLSRFSSSHNSNPYFLISCCFYNFITPSRGLLWHSYLCSFLLTTLLLQIFVQREIRGNCARTSIVIKASTSLQRFV